MQKRAAAWQMSARRANVRLAARAPLNDKMAELNKARRHKIEARAAELVAERNILQRKGAAGVIGYDDGAPAGAPRALNYTPKNASDAASPYAE